MQATVRNVNASGFLCYLSTSASLFRFFHLFPNWNCLFFVSTSATATLVSPKCLHTIGSLTHQHTQHVLVQRTYNTLKINMADANINISPYQGSSSNFKPIAAVFWWLWRHQMQICGYFLIISKPFSHTFSNKRPRNLKTIHSPKLAIFVTFIW